MQLAGAELVRHDTVPADDQDAPSEGGGARVRAGPASAQRAGHRDPFALPLLLQRHVLLEVTYLADRVDLHVLPPLCPVSVPRWVSAQSQR